MNESDALVVAKVREHWPVIKAMLDVARRGDRGFEWSPRSGREGRSLTLDAITAVHDLRPFFEPTNG